MEISLGYVGNTKKLILGEITALTADFPSSGPATLQVEGFDLLQRADSRHRLPQVWGEGATPSSGLRDSEIVSEIASEMGFNASVDETPVRTEPRVQDHITNLDFLQELAEANGYFLGWTMDILYFKRQRSRAILSDSNGGRR